MRLLYCYFNNLNGIKDISISFTGEYLFDTQILDEKGQVDDSKIQKNIRVAESLKKFDYIKILAK